jgi:hypothetical protein
MALEDQGFQVQVVGPDWQALEVLLGEAEPDGAEFLQQAARRHRTIPPVLVIRGIANEDSFPT